MSGRIIPPWKRSPKLLARLAHLARLKRAGLLPPGDKASLRAAAALATEHKRKA